MGWVGLRCLEFFIFVFVSGLSFAWRRGGRDHFRYGNSTSNGGVVVGAYVTYFLTVLLFRGSCILRDGRF